MVFGAVLNTCDYPRPHCAKAEKDGKKSLGFLTKYFLWKINVSLGVVVPIEVDKDAHVDEQDG